MLPNELRPAISRRSATAITELREANFSCASVINPGFERTMEIADEIMDEYRDTFAALAK